MREEPIDHVAIGHDLARKADVNPDKLRPKTRRMWEARGLAVIALSRGDLTETKKSCGHSIASTAPGRC